MSDTKKFDVFLCHNSQDKPAVEKIAEELKIRGIKPWLDKWELQPGLPWQPELERQIKNIRAGAVFVGSSGLGPWQNMEIRAFLQQFVKRGCPVIPVLLTNGPKKPKLPLFLEGNTWVDFRDSQSNPMDKLIWGITGKKPIDKINGYMLTDSFSYSHLEKLLSQGRWREADKETCRCMLKILGREGWRWIDYQSVDNFPYEDLDLINKLWEKHSNGKFGFSIQKKIYQSLGGTRKYDTQVWKSFGDKVGWRKKGKWLLYRELTFNLDTSYEGQLPSGIWVLRGGRFGLWEVEWGLRGSIGLIPWYCLVKHWAGNLFLSFVALFFFSGTLGQTYNVWNEVISWWIGTFGSFWIIIMFVIIVFSIGSWFSQTLQTYSKKLAHILYYTLLVLHGSVLFGILSSYDYYYKTDYLAIPFVLAAYCDLYFFWWWLALRPLQKPLFFGLLLRQNL
jgi:hypothetical protein